MRTATTIKRSPLLKFNVVKTFISALVMVKKTPVKDKIIPSNLFQVILSFKKMMLSIVVIIGFVAPIIEEEIAVVSLSAEKNKTW